MAVDVDTMQASTSRFLVQQIKLGTLEGKKQQQSIIFGFTVPQFRLSRRNES